jgi:glycosyltransferase involved in cell wall biosynthesis
MNVLMLDLLSYTPYYDRYLCESLRRLGVKVTLSAAGPYDDPGYFRRHHCPTDRALIDIVARLRIRNGRLRKLLTAIEAALNLVWTVLRCWAGDFDVLHVQWMPLLRLCPVDLLCVALARKSGVKAIYTVHNKLPHDTGEKYKDVFVRAYRSMDALICHDRHTKEQLISEFQLEPERIWVIPHGTLFHDQKNSEVGRVRAKLGFRETDCVMLCQGIIRPYKGIDFLLDAWESVQATCNSARLIIAGTGDKELLDAIKQHASRRNLDTSVYLDLRFIPDEELHDYNNSADVLLYPYRTASTSGALMTGIVYAKAIVATNLPGFRTVVEHGRTALLVEYGDTETLARYLVILAQRRDMRQTLAANVASMDVSNRSWDAIANMTKRCYESLSSPGATHFNAASIPDSVHDRS